MRQRQKALATYRKTQASGHPAIGLTPCSVTVAAALLKKKNLEVTEKTRENPHGYWCRPCGRSREHSEQWCSSDYCKERILEEDDLKARGFNNREELYQHYRDTLAGI